MGEFGVSGKEATKKSSNTSSSVFGLGAKKVQQSLEAFPNTKTRMMRQHHNHHHRSLSSPFGNDSFVAGDGDGDGPTTAYLSFTNHNHNINFVSGASASALGAAAAATIDGGGAAVIRPLQQPFDISSAYYTSATTTTLKSPAGGMAASLGYPFTNAQWKELERQAMIYKYMMASVPVPPDLLVTPPPPMMDGHGGGGFNLRLSSSSTDPEPGRCKRTDGKKWRCSRDVAPNHKYCERHLHRGRPRSRKPVEVVLHDTNNNNNVNDHQIKRARHDCNNSFPPMAASTRKDGSSSNFLASTTCQPYLESSLSLHNNSCFGVKTSNFDSLACVSSNKQQPRGLEWMLNGDPISLGASSDSEWHSLMHNNKVAMTTGRSYNNNTDPPQYLNSLALYSSGLYQQDKRLPLFLNPLVVPMESLQPEKPRGFIDAWSNTEAGESNNNHNNKNNSAASSSICNKLSLSSSLDLSMGGGGSTIGMGLGLMEPDDGNTQQHHHHHNDDDDDTTKISLFSNWLNPAAPCWVQAPSSTPGGPLAEVLRPSTVTATTTSDDPETMVSSPSGVLHKKLASLSDSSGNSSPTTVASSRGQF